MGNRRNAVEKKKSARLVVKKETIRDLRSLSADELRAAAGGWFVTTLPSCHGC